MIFCLALEDVALETSWAPTIPPLPAFIHVTTGEFLCVCFFLLLVFSSKQKSLRLISCSPGGKPLRERCLYGIAWETESGFFAFCLLNR
jgi:hypothetical protein